MKDEIIAELWAVKDQIAEECNYNIDILAADLRAGAKPKVLKEEILEINRTQEDVKRLP